MKTLEEKRKYRNDYMREYWKKHPEIAKIKHKKYYENHKEERKIKDKIYREKNKERIKDYLKTYYEANKEEEKKRRALYRKRCKQKIKQANILYRAKNKDKIRKKRQEQYKNNCLIIKERVKQYVNNNPDKIFNIRKRRSILKRNVFIETVDRREIYLRDKGECQICFQKVKLNLKYPHPKSISIDHIVPLSRGGEHSKENCQLTHLSCNIRMNNKLNKQLRLFG